MRRRSFLVNGLVPGGLAILLPAHAVSETDAASGIRTALERGAVAAVGQLGRLDGFLTNPRVHIHLPSQLQSLAKVLRAMGQQQRVEELETAMNRAAEAAAPEAKALLVSAVRNMSVEDARNVITGGDDSLTRFFAGKTRDPLGVKFLPIVTHATEKVGLAAKYNQLAGKGASFGIVKAENGNIQRYVTERALDGLFLMISDEEKKIRENPVATGSAILTKVFGGLR